MSGRSPPGDDAAVEAVIRACLVEFGADREGFAWADPDLGRFSQVYSRPGARYWVAESADGEILGGVGIVKAVTGRKAQAAEQTADAGKEDTDKEKGTEKKGSIAGILASSDRMQELGEQLKAALQAAQEMEDAFAGGAGMSDYSIGGRDTAAALTSGEVMSTRALLVDWDTRTAVAQRGASDRINPASMTKILTLLVAAEHVEDLDDTFTITR